MKQQHLLLRMALASCLLPFLLHYFLPFAHRSQVLLKIPAKLPAIPVERLYTGYVIIMVNFVPTALMTL